MTNENTINLNASTNQDYTATPSIPDKDAAPKPGTVRDYVKLPPNLAGDTQLTTTVLDKIQEYFTKFKAQDARTQLKTDMKSADRMLRVTKTRDRTSATDQQEDTLSNVSSTSFYNAHRIITAGQRAVMFYGDEMPVIYESIPESPDFETDLESERVAFEQNKTLRYTFDVGHMVSKIKESLFYVNKYGQEALSLEWDFFQEERVERVPKTYDDEGRAITFAFEKKMRTVRDYPTLSRHDLKDFWYDTQILDIQNQKCILRRTQKGLEFFYQKQKDGEFLNVGQLTSDQYFKSESEQGSEVLSDRQEDAGETPESQETGNIEAWPVWIRLPINEKGKWDPEKTLPVWFESVWAGNIENDAKCVQLRRNPYHHQKNPYKIVYSHLDDKGAVRMGYATLLECLYEEETATLNEAIDNKTLRTRKPWIAERGNVLSRNLKFRQGNQTFWVKSGTGGTALKEINVQDTTNNMMPFLEWIRENFKRTAGTDKSVAGEYAGARTTSTEVQTVQRQAMKPALEDTEMLAEQYFPWIAEMVALLWRQFGDPTRILQIVEEGKTYPIKPTTLYGEFKTRVVSIGQFESDILAQQERTNFIRAAYQFVAPLMGRKGQIEFWRDDMKQRKMKNVDKYFPETANHDAERLAWYENILIFEQGQEVLPDTSDDHDVHIPIITNQLNNYKLLPPEERDENAVRIGTLHLMIHRQMQQQLAAAQQAAVAGQQERQALPAGSTGEVAGATLGGIAGQQASSGY